MSVVGSETELAAALLELARGLRGAELAWRARPPGGGGPARRGAAHRGASRRLEAVARGMRDALLEAGASLYGAAWEVRRRAYARGLVRPRRVSTRVVSIGNLTAGGTGKTTLTLHLARLALERGRDVAVVCRRYRPGPEGFGDEECQYVDALGRDRVLSGAPKHELAARAAAAGRNWCWWTTDSRTGDWFAISIWC